MVLYKYKETGNKTSTERKKKMKRLFKVKFHVNGYTFTSETYDELRNLWKTAYTIARSYKHSDLPFYFAVYDINTNELLLKVMGLQVSENDVYMCQVTKSCKYGKNIKGLVI